MARSLIIVESPAKTKTLKSILGADYRIEASMGHVRDLPKSALGVEVEHDFAPKYVAIPERKEILKKLKAAAEQADVVYLASDPDREGEAIAWHLEQALELKSAKRIQFNEITRTAVLRSLEEPRTVNMDLVNAQQGRRVLDRLVGYKLSPLLWRKVKRNLSAGRVQSVAVRMICDREREILAFVPEEYWNITAKLTPLDRLDPFEARLIQKNGEKAGLHNQEEADNVLSDLKNAEYSVKKIARREQRRNAAAPFITSTLQQEASRKLGFSARRTMTVAQQLYEGLDMGEEGTSGLITYMRTDSTRVAAEAVDEARKFIETTYGRDYLPDNPNIYKKKGAQDAHEAIRPTSVMRRPEMVSKYLDATQLKLYRLIWQRFLASQMKPAVFDVVTIDVAAAGCLFRATGSTAKFPGFMAVYSEGKDDQKLADEERPPLPVVSEGETLRLIQITPEQKFTEPPPRYTEATLVKTLEENGIGRPSTYATIISTIQDRGYVVLEEKKFSPTELGLAVTDLLVSGFPDIMDVKFTATIETKLDSIEEGRLDWVKLLADFYPPFEQSLGKAMEQMERVRIAPKETDEVCPNCGRKMVIRESRFGQFLGCSGYPECKTTMKMSKKLNVKCPVCKEGEVVEKQSRKGRIFYGCDRYPECSFVSWDKPTDKQCPTCGSVLSERRWKNRPIGLKCISPDCDYQESYSRKKDETEEEQAVA
ncbi:MAG: type I DNA topoisomerase [Armatimonadota bacterium]|nr:type I DNA topoisomerase [Armatimonadota bacterium]